MHKKALISVVLIASLFFTSVLSAYGEKYAPSKTVLEQEIEITVDVVNVRNGPGLNFPVTGTVSKGDVLDVLGMLGNWYVVYLPNGTVGVMSTEFARVVKIGDSYLPEGGNDLPLTLKDDSDEALLFALVNADRSENKLPPYAWDEKLNKVAQIKAEDMVKNKYFGHSSETYGTPFQMLKGLKIAYKSASENLAGNNSVQNAHIKIMSHPANRTNIINTRFTKMGVGIANSEEYGKIIVQLFIQE